MTGFNWYSLLPIFAYALLIAKVLGSLFPTIPGAVLVTFGQSFTEIRIGAEIHWSLPFLILDIQVSSIGSQE